MSDRAFFETNLFVYSVDNREPLKREAARDLLLRYQARGNGVISFQVVKEFFNVALKSARVPMTPHHCARYLSTVFRQYVMVHSSMSLYSIAVTIQPRYQLSWYDSLIVAAAAEADCSVIYTEDLQHGSKIEGMRIENPFRAKRQH